MKKLFLCLCIFASTKALSQNITFADTDLKGKYELNIDGKSTDRIFVFQHNVGDNQSNDKYVEYDFGLKAKPTEKYKKSAGYFFTPNFYTPFIYDGKVSYIYQSGGRKQKTWYLRVMQPFDNDKFINLDSSESYYIGSINTYVAIMSEDSSCFVITRSTHVRNEPFDLKYYLVDYHYKVTKSASIKIPAMDEKNALVMELKLYGKYLVQTIKISGKSDRVVSYKYIISNSEDNTTSEVNLPEIPDAAYTSYYSYMSNPDEITVKGFYNEWSDAKKADRKSIAKGVYTYVINLKDAKLTSNTKTEMNEKGKTALEAIKADRGSEQYLSDFIRMSDGTSLIVADCATPSSSSSMTHTNYSNGQSYSTSSYTAAKYFNLYVLSFDAKGNFQWSKKIERKEKDIAHTGGHMRTGFGSYGLLEGKSAIHLYCNDKDNVVDHTITATGEITSKPVVFGDAKDDVVIFPDEGLTLSENEIVFPCLKNKRSTLVKLGY